MRYCEVPREGYLDDTAFRDVCEFLKAHNTKWVVSKIAEAKKGTYYDPNGRASNQRLESRAILNPGGDADENSLEV